MRHLKIKLAALAISLLSLSAIALDDPAQLDSSVWEGNNLGRSHKVPPPWTPVTVNETTVSVWGRDIILSGSAMPAQIVNQDDPMLTDAVQFLAEKEDGEIVTLMPGELSVREKHDDKAVFEGNATGGGIAVKTLTTIEFDGFMKFDCTFSAPENIKVKRLFMESRLRPDLIGPHYVSPFRGYSPMLILDTWGKIEEKRGFPFYNTFAISGTKYSWHWSSDCPENWRLQRRNRALEVEPTADTRIFRVHFIDAYAPIEIGTERKITFGLQAGPFRPPLKDWRKYEALWWEEKPFSVTKVKSAGLEPLICLWPFSTKGTAYRGPEHSDAYKRAARMAFNVPWPEDPEKFRSWMKETQEAGGLVCPYTNTDNFDLNWGPGSGKYRDEWAGVKLPEKIPEESTNGFRPKHGFRVCYHSDSWQDYYTWILVKALKEFNFDGYYVDNVSSKACKNPDHPDSHHPYVDEDGREWPRIPMMKARDFYVRLYKAVKEVKADAPFFANGASSPFTIWDFNLTLEYLSRVAGSEQYWTEFAKAEDLKGTFFRGHQVGCMRLVFPQYAGSNLTPEATRAMIAVLTAADTVNYWEVSSHTATLQKFNELKGRFKIWEAEWLPFWENSELVQCDVADVVSTIYRKEGDMLLVLSRLGGDKDGKSAPVPVSINSSKLFGDINSLQAWDAETQKSLSLKSNMVLNDTFHMLELELNPHDFRAVRLSAKPQQ